MTEPEYKTVVREDGAWYECRFKLPNGVWCGQRLKLNSCTDNDIDKQVTNSLLLKRIINECRNFNLPIPSFVPSHLL